MELNTNNEEKGKRLYYQDQFHVSLTGYICSCSTNNKYKCFSVQLDILILWDYFTFLNVLCNIYSRTYNDYLVILLLYTKTQTSMCLEVVKKFVVAGGGWVGGGC